MTDVIGTSLILYIPIFEKCTICIIWWKKKIHSARLSATGPMTKRSNSGVIAQRWPTSEKKNVERQRPNWSEKRKQKAAEKRIPISRRSFRYCCPCPCSAPPRPLVPAGRHFFHRTASSPPPPRRSHASSARASRVRLPYYRPAAPPSAHRRRPARAILAGIYHCTV
jgi:hypothetical protein